jgi:hypothetical protein
VVVDARPKLVLVSFDTTRDAATGFLKTTFRWQPMSNPAAPAGNAHILLKFVNQFETAKAIRQCGWATTEFTSNVAADRMSVECFSKVLSPDCTITIEVISKHLPTLSPSESEVSP